MSGADRLLTRDQDVSLPEKTGALRDIVCALRPKHWVKNLFVLLPLVFSHNMMNVKAILTTLAALFCFCMASSATYLVNDILDLENDRVHPEKRQRPLASGRISIPNALMIAAALMALSLGASFYIRPFFAGVLGLYVLTSLVYSAWLKHRVILDVMTIGLFFILRVLGGAVALEVEISPWLIICTGTLALFIGFNKRRHELGLLKEESGKHRRVLENYSQYLIDQMIGILTASTLVFYTLYTVDEKTIQRFGTSHLILTVPFVCYGIFRYLYHVHKRDAGGDPVGIVLSDKALMVNIVCWLVVAAAVIYAR